MDYKNILVEKKNSYVTISLNRPDVLNSFNYEMADDFLSAFRNAVEDKHVRAILITGSGRAFCAGQDLEEATRKNGPSIDEIIDHTYNPICIQISNSTKPVVCYVNGVAA
ncbi:MAG: enoyl-CoA hydratase-related protein, partial [Bacteroidota bacterium]|nr:enoyl-CoA hydratase-related protein [Bacteroidota bacterium]